MGVISLLLLKIFKIKIYGRVNNFEQIKNISPERFGQ